MDSLIQELILQLEENRYDPALDEDIRDILGVNMYHHPPPSLSFSEPLLMRDPPQPGQSSGGADVCVLQRTASQSLQQRGNNHDGAGQEVMQTGHMCSQSGDPGQRQFLPTQPSSASILTSAPVSHPAAPAPPHYMLDQWPVFHVPASAPIIHPTAPPEYLPDQWSVVDVLTGAPLIHPAAAPPQYLLDQWSVVDVLTGAHMSHPSAAPSHYPPDQWSVANVSTSAPVNHPAPPPQTVQDVQMMAMPHTFETGLQYAGLINGEPVYKFSQSFAPLASAGPPENTSDQSQNRNLEDDIKYVKKPPNAFMLFLREQRPKVDPKILEKGSGTVNAELGQKWKSLSKEQQAKYYQQAQRERELHQQQHPNWSAKLNYGKKKKRERRNLSSAEVLPSEPSEDTKPSKRRCL